MTFSCVRKGTYLAVSHSPNLLGPAKRPMGIQVFCTESDQPWPNFAVVSLFSDEKGLPVLFESSLMLPL